MLTAMDSGGLYVPAWFADRSKRYMCPECFEPVVLKVGTIVTPHYAHHPDSLCALATGEGDRHREMKRQAAALFPQFRAEFEVPFDKDHRADVVIGRHVFECQASSLSIATWEERTSYYNHRGYAVLWLWDEARSGWGASGEARVPAEVRFCHQKNYGAVYVLSKYGDLFAVHYASVTRSSEWGGEYYDRTLKTIKAPMPRAIERPVLHVRRGPDGHGLVHFGEGAWWKKDRAA